MKKIKVAIVEDEPVYLYSLKKFLDNQDDIYVSLTTAGGKEDLKLIIQDNPDVILMDINLNGDDNAGIKLTRVLKYEYKMDSKIIMLTGYTTEEVISDSITAGAIKYVVKSNSEKIPDIIRSVMVFNPDAIIAELYQKKSISYKGLENKLDMQAIIIQLQKLTPQQLNHLRLMLEEKTRKEIANELGISFNTVKNTINAIYKAIELPKEDSLRRIYINCIDELLNEHNK